MESLVESFMESLSSSAGGPDSSGAGVALEEMSSMGESADKKLVMCFFLIRPATSVESLLLALFLVGVCSITLAVLVITRAGCNTRCCCCCCCCSLTLTLSNAAGESQRDQE